MRSSWLIGIALSSLVWVGLVSAQEASLQSNTAPAGIQYDVIVIRVGSLVQGTLAFSASTPDSGTANPIPSGSTTSTTSTTTPSSTGTNPVAAGDFGPVGDPNGTTGNTTGNTSGSITANTSGTTTTGTTTTTSTADPPSYWTRARANGEVATQTNDASSSDYWTRARVNGQGAASATSGSFGVGNLISSGGFIAAFGEETNAGTWYAVDLGSFSLWYATGNSVDGDVTYAGYATADTIVGRTSIGSSGLLEAFFTGSFFIGQVATTDPSAEPMQ
jgi:hypothetical protein